MQPKGRIHKHNKRRLLRGFWHFLGSLDKLGVTGSSPVSPILSHYGVRSCGFINWKQLVETIAETVRERIGMN